MREVDEALARAFAERGQIDLPQGVPPAPHLPARRSRPQPTGGPKPIDRSNCSGRHSF